jgi:hypothetical protein
VVRVRRDEGLAIRIGPEQCAVVREDAGEALAGGRAGQPLSRCSVLLPGFIELAAEALEALLPWNVKPPFCRSTALPSRDCHRLNTSMKRRDAIEAIQKAFQKLSARKAGGETRVDFVSSTESSYSKTAPEPRDPEFEFEGWRFYAKTGFWEDEATDGGDASVISPDGTVFCLVWTAGESLHHEFDFTPSFGPMLYLRVPSSVRLWDELRQQFLQLVPALERELRSRAQP